MKVLKQKGLEKNIELIRGDITETVPRYLKSNPKWYSSSNAFVEKSAEEFIETIGKNGFIIVIGECSYGVSFIIKNNNICMNGKK